MYKIYFRQAIEMLKMNKFISVIAVGGTALAIMMIMTIIVTEEVKNIAVAPEINRHKTLYISREIRTKPENAGMQAGNVSFNMIKEYLYPLETPKYVSAVGYTHSLASVTGNDEVKKAVIRPTDAAYWKIFSFDFIAGRPFLEEDVESGLPVVVLSETFSRNMFRGEDPLNKTLELNFKSYRVIGVVKDVSPVFKNATGEVWVPLTEGVFKNTGFTCLLVAENKRDFPRIIDEVRLAEKKYESVNAWNLYLRGPETNWEASKGSWMTSKEAFKDDIMVQKRKLVFIVFILLLIPAINLSGFSVSRIKKRVTEIGVRKAFGAKKHVILFQVLYENMITSLLGGVIGLVFSWLAVYYLKDWLLEIPKESSLPITTLVSVPVFIAVFLACFLLNIISAGIPAFRASKMSIINSINQNEQ